MPDPVFSKYPSWAEVGGGIAVILSGFLGWWGKHFQRKHREVGSSRDSARIAEIHRFLFTPDPDLRMTPGEQLRMVARFVSEPDADGNRVSLFRKVLNSIASSLETQAHNSAAQTKLMEQQSELLTEKLRRLEDTWAGMRPDHGGS